MIVALDARVTQDPSEIQRSCQRTDAPEIRAITPMAIRAPARAEAEPKTIRIVGARGRKLNSNR